MATINHKTYNEGTETFKDFSVYDGKDTLIFKVDGAGSAVGIGTATPGSPLDIVSSENVLVTITSTDAGSKIKLSDPDSDVFIQNQSSLLSLGFSSTQNSQVLHITSTGNVGISTTSPTSKLDVNGIAGAQGIKFPVTQVASADPNTLDDYEEGTFSPTVVYSTSGTPTYAVQLGRYTKIGRTVQVQIYLSFNENGAVGNVSLGGLPFTSVNSIARSTASVFSFGLTGVTSSVTGFVNSNATTIALFLNDNAATVLSSTYTDGDQDIYVTVTYEAA